MTNLSNQFEELKSIKKMIKPKYSIGDECYFFKTSADDSDNFLFKIFHGIIIEVSIDIDTYCYGYEINLCDDNSIYEAQFSTEQFIFRSLDEGIEILTNHFKTSFNSLNEKKFKE